MCEQEQTGGKHFIYVLTFSYVFNIISNQRKSLLKYVLRNTCSNIYYDYIWVDNQLKLVTNILIQNQFTLKAAQPTIF